MEINIIINEIYIFANKQVLNIAIAINGVKFGGWGISLESVKISIIPIENKFL